MMYNGDFLWYQLVSLIDFKWENPLFLFGLMIPVFMFIYKYGLQRKKRLRIVLSVPNDFKTNPIVALLRFIPDLLQGLIIASIVIVMAEPYKSLRHQELKAEGIDMAIAIDISTSMNNQDVRPSRLENAKQICQDFVKSRLKHDQIAVVAFAGEPKLVSPITRDEAFLVGSLKKLKSTLISEEGTALGDAMGTCINQLRESENPKKIGILISDGNNTAGNLTPNTSTELANLFKIKFYTIAVGQQGNLIDPVDETTLNEIAIKTKGQFFRANDRKALEKIFKDIDLLEKTKMKTIRWESHEDHSRGFIQLAILLFFLNLLLKITPIGNIIED